MSNLLVTLTVDDLRALVGEAVRDALAAVQPQEPPAMLSPGEAARLLRVSERQVRNLVSQGKIKALRVGGRWRIRRADLETVGSGDAP